MGLIWAKQPPLYSLYAHHKQTNNTPTFCPSQINLITVPSAELTTSIQSVSPVGSRQQSQYIVPKSCIYSQSAPEDGRNCRPETRTASLKESIKQILPHLVGCWYHRTGDARSHKRHVRYVKSKPSGVWYWVSWQAVPDVLKDHNAAIFRVKRFKESACLTLKGTHYGPSKGCALLA